tara:strand:+ start:4533 stop:6377 length:1845 start_codon:yes stop_codon:yes gene_type:complete
MKQIFFLLIFNFIFSEITTIDLITTNDMHGFINEQDAYFMNPQYPPKIIGGSGFYNYLNELKKKEKSEDILIVDGGNFFQGSNFGMHDNGISMIEWMNTLEYDAMVLGQYDFVLGVEKLNQALLNSKFDILGSNIECENCIPNLKPYIIESIKGINIGILGIMNSNIPELVPSSKLSGASFDYEVSTMKKWVPEMKNNGADIIIILTSSGVPWDREVVYKDFVEKKNENSEAKSLNAIEMGYFADNVDLIVSGGISKGYRSAWYDPKSHVYTIQNYGNGTSFGHIKLKVDSKNKKFMGIDYVNNNEVSHTLFFDDYSPDMEIRNLINNQMNDIGNVNFELMNKISNVNFELNNNFWNVPSVNTNDLEVITWNCEFFPTANDSTITALSEIVNDLDADIIAFQEIRKAGWFEKLMKNLPKYSYVISLQASFMDLAIIYKKDLFEFLNHKELFVDNDYNFAGRPPLQLDLNYKKNNQKISLINLHMKCCDSGLKRRQGASIMLYDYLDKNLTNENTFIVLGDWNDDLKDKPKEHCFDSFFNDDRFYFANQEIVYDISQASYPKEPYVSFLDHILVTENVQTNKVYTLPMNEWMNSYDTYEKYISDHMPVYLSFKIK